MNRTDATLDLIANAALVGAGAAILVRPRHVAAIARSPLAPAAYRIAGQAARGVARSLAPRPRPRTTGLKRLLSRLSRSQDLTRRVGRRLNDSAALLAFSVLADSAIEHYRGSFHNRAMYMPLATAALTLAGSLFGSVDPRAKRHAVRDTIYAMAAATGVAGFCFHCYNILKRPGGLSWLNLFYAAPIGAPWALLLAGLLGRGAERVRDTPARSRPTLLGLPASRTLAAVAAGGLAGSVGEATLLHFRGAYHDPAMVLPVTVPPVGAALLATAAVHPSPRVNSIARWWLKLTALLGFVGVGFHIFGVARNMGGWRNWSQNVLNGPPLPAPPSFTGLALAGLAALALIEEESDV